MSEPLQERHIAGALRLMDLLADLAPDERQLLEHGLRSRQSARQPQPGAILTGRQFVEGGAAMWKYVLAWFPMVVIAVANGALRELWYGRHLSELAAHQLSSLTAIMLFGVYIRFVVRTWRPSSAAQAIAIGLLWLVMTVAFEFLFGHYVAGHEWERLLHDYDILAGRVWLLVIAWVAVAPRVFFRASR